MVDLSSFLFAQIKQNIWKFCPSGWISPTPMNIGFPILYKCIYYNPPMNPVKFRQGPLTSTSIDFLYCLDCNSRNSMRWCHNSRICFSQLYWMCHILLQLSLQKIPHFRFNYTGNNYSPSRSRNHSLLCCGKLYFAFIFPNELKFLLYRFVFKSSFRNKHSFKHNS